METIHGAELILLSFPEQHEGEYVGGLLTIATPMGKNWHWLRAEEYVNVDALLASALVFCKKCKHFLLRHTSGNRFCGANRPVTMYVRAPQGR